MVCSCLSKSTTTVSMPPPSTTRMLDVHPRIDSDPVDFPGLAAIVGKGLLEPAGFRSDLRDDEPHQDGAAIQGLLVIDPAAPVLETADGGCGQSPAAAACEVEAPLV